MKWITRKNIKVDRVACPWLVRRFIDQDAEFLFVEEAELLAVAAREGAIPFDAPRFSEVQLNHRGERCTFEAIIEDYGLRRSWIASHRRRLSRDESFRRREVRKAIPGLRCTFRVL